MQTLGQTLGITGKIGSGKSTVAIYLVKNKGFVEYSMAGPLKKIGEIFHFTPSQLYGTQEQKLEINEHWGVSGRHFLQKFGTEICRDALPKVIPEMKLGGHAVWVRLFEIERLKNPEVNYVVSDVRFLDEAESIKNLGGKIIRVDRNSIEKKGQEHTHVSELEQDRIQEDTFIANDSNLETLYKRLDNLFCVDFLL